MANEKYKNYVYDLGMLLKEKALEAKATKDRAVNGDITDYDLGYLMALHELVSLMQQQAEVFDIELDNIGLGDIDPELDLL
ncbi:hypothetical protein [Shewanella putrefaciens]|uniref:hypothetical protein n=1 Tax=Shewanella putrefaciens TaxID=24 RepID=UPI002858553B|nr:hypothetical protein [Shewanella putrefaciens]MDR6965606.1 hypothetical protein [Shewanella putrefaciens]